MLGARRRDVDPGARLFQRARDAQLACRKPQRPTGTPNTSSARCTTTPSWRVRWAWCATFSAAGRSITKRAWPGRPWPAIAARGLNAAAKFSRQACRFCRWVWARGLPQQRNFGRRHRRVVDHHGPRPCADRSDDRPMEGLRPSARQPMAPETYCAAESQPGAAYRTCRRRPATFVSKTSWLRYRGREGADAARRLARPEAPAKCSA